MSVHTPVAAVIILMLTGSLVETKNVVFLPFMITSHIRLHTFVAEELTKMGHNAWLGVPSDLDKVNMDFKGVKTFSTGVTNINVYIANLEGTVNLAIESGTEPDWSWMAMGTEAVLGMIFQILQDGKLLEHIKSLKPDLLVIDWYPTVDERVAIAHKLKIPFAVLSADKDYVTSRVPFNPVAEVYNSPYLRDKATLFEKVQAVIQVMSPLFQHLYNDRGFIQRLSPDEPNAPAANELMSQAEVYIIESDPIYDNPRPTLPNFKLIGGVSSGPGTVLKEPFKSFVERSKKAGVGVAVLSFGTLFMNLPKKIETKLVAVLRRIQLNTIWRANFTSPDPDKILTSTWIPQNDLLGNKDVKMFISHCGAHSIYEGIYHGIPLVCLPIFYDQFRNGERVVEKGYGLSLDFLKASEDELVNIIEEVASSQRIGSFIGTASNIYRELYKNPRKEAAFWLDHVMRYGGSYMRYSGQKIPMYLFLLDYFIVFLAGVLFVVGLWVICFAIKYTLRLLFKPKGHIKKD